MDSAVIFDVDGVLLDLTPQEEDAFFLAFERRYGITGLSRDWDSYKVRNDEHIIAEILARHGIDPDERRRRGERVSRDPFGGPRLRHIARHRNPRRARIARIARGLIVAGIATANLLPAAKLRLEACGLWPYVSGLAFGAEGSGHKRETVARAIAATGLPKQSHHLCR